MMGEFIIYYRGRIVGGIYDDRLLVKPTESATSYPWFDDFTIISQSFHQEFAETVLENKK